MTSVKKVLLTACCITLIASVKNTYAAGISVSPSYIQKDLAKEEASTPLTYTNETQSPITLTFDTKEINTQSYPSIQFLTEKTEQPARTASWVEFDRNSLTILPKQTEKVTLSFSPKLSPGGHYAAFMAKVTPENSNVQKKESQIALEAMIVTPLFIRAKDGMREEKLELKNIDTTAFLLLFPQEIEFLISNKGNIESIPYGKITISGWFTKNVATGVLNEGSTFLLPSSSRRFGSKLRQNEKYIIPGVYTIKGNIRYTTKEIQINSWFITLGTANVYAILLLIATTPPALYFLVKKIRKNRLQSHYADIE